MVVRSTLIFAGVYAVSFVLAYAAGVPVAGYFFLEEEFGAVLFASALFSLFAIAVFAVVYAVQPNVRWLGYAALGLALVAFGVAQIPALLDALALRSTNPYLIGSAQDRAIAASFLLPAFVMLLIAWWLLRRRWLVAHRLEHRTVWPCFTIILAGLLALNRAGLELIGSVVRWSSTDWLVGLWAVILAIATGVLLMLALLEWWFRRRWFARRAAAD
jgi:hypothetical protein